MKLKSNTQARGKDGEMEGAERDEAKEKKKEDLYWEKAADTEPPSHSLWVVGGLQGGSLYTADWIITICI